MGKWISDAHMDLILSEILKSNMEVVCSAQPATYYNAVWPGLWLPDTPYVIGDEVHPPTTNGFIYECTTGGTSGAVEPGWASTQDATFSDNGITWKAHENYSLAANPLNVGDIVLSDGLVDGRMLAIAQKMGVITHGDGVVAHTALVDTETKTLHFVTTAETTIAGDNDVVTGRTTIFFAFNIFVRDPV